MFTGIIEAVGTIDDVDSRGTARRLRIETPFADDLRVDQSVAVNGACLTVVANDDRFFEADVVEETLAKTNLGALAEGHRVNLERAMAAGGRFDGHFVQGHVDATGEILSVEALDGSHMVTVAFPAEHTALVVPVGSITLDGISLTVAQLEANRLTVAIIPHTWERTTVSDWRTRTRVNLEFDLLGKYVVRALEARLGGR